MVAALDPAPHYDLSSPGFFQSPEATFRRLREECPVHYHEGLSAWVLTAYADVTEALKSPVLSVDRNGEIGRNGSREMAGPLRLVNEEIQSWMVFSDPPRHTRLRGAVKKAFTPQALRALTPMIEELVDELLDGAASRGRFEVLTDLGVPLAERVTARMLGLPDEIAPRLKKWTEEIFGFLGATEASDEAVLANVRGIGEFRKYLATEVATRRRSPGDDLISQILRDSESDFSETEVIGLVMTLIAGAYETTAHSITGGLFALLSVPEQCDMLRDDPSLGANAVEEILRYYGPAFAVQRRAIGDTEVGGIKVCARERIYCMLHAANHDPAAFPRPEMLDIRRSSCRQVGLGLGPHFCLGAWLTRLETEVAITRTLARFPSLSLLQDFRPTWVGNFAIRGLSELPLSTGAPIAAGRASGFQRTLGEI